ncbi:hepatitis A virus cellular receptor 2 homolog [Pyxicephalus adspersus]|uniref:hepatitis A virus cellular receptor 2 homolog n=1 Tax=Pyxicephalus adspersus TaxID=30357 RepID=UPI003B5960FB
MEILTRKIIFTANLIIHMSAASKTVLDVKQPEVIAAEPGQSAAITCSFVYDSPSYTAKWTRGCDNSLPLTDPNHSNGRIKTTHRGSSSTESESPCCERYFILTIANVTENDSGTYCCHIQTAHGQDGVGLGTKLEITQKVYIADGGHKVLYNVMESFCLIILSALLVF